MQNLKNSSAKLLAYYPSGNRTRKTVVKSNITETRYYLGDYGLFEKTGSGSGDYQRQTTTLSDGEKVFARIEQKDSETPVVRYQFDNHLGSASLELDTTAAIISYEEYHPFGSTAYRSGKTETEVSLKRYKYNGKEKDDETGLYYYGARYYAAWLGRFVSVDPLAHQTPSWNPYHYCHNNPFNLVDPSGMSAEGVGDDTPVEDNTIKTNFSIKQGDENAKKDIQSLANNEKNQDYIKFRDDGGVYLDFEGVSDKKKERLLKKDEGLKLIDDLSKATYTDDAGNIHDAKILYQTEGPFEFAGIKESHLDGSWVPNEFSYKKGDNAIIERTGKVRAHFIFNASVTTYGKNKGQEVITILPQKGFQGQTVIAPGDPTLFVGQYEINTWDNNMLTKETKNLYVNERKDMVMHELRENLFRTQSGMSYNDAHKATNEMYFPKYANNAKCLSIKSFIFN